MRNTNTTRQLLVAEMIALRGLRDTLSESLDTLHHSASVEVEQEILAMRAVVRAHAAAWPDAEPAPTLPAHLSDAEIELARQAGLDPVKEYGPHDPRATSPRCVHGVPFSEECTECGKLDLG